MLTVTRSTPSAPSACLASAATALLSRPPLKATTTGLASATVWMSSTRVRTRLSISVNTGIARPYPISIQRNQSTQSPQSSRSTATARLERDSSGGLGRQGRPGRPGRLLLVKPDGLLRCRRPALLRYRGGVPSVEDADDPPIGREMQELAQRWMVSERSSPE